MPLFSTIYLTACAVWFLSELYLLIFKRSRKKDEDKKSLLLLWIAILGGIFLANTSIFAFLGRFPEWLNLVRWSGIAIMILGIVFRFIAIKTLGEYFRVNVVTSDDQRLITTGFYRIIRHPTYSGSLVTCLGMGLAVGSWGSLLILMIPISLAYHFRMNVEEEALLKHFGDDYKEYMKKTYRLIPYLY